METLLRFHRFLFVGLMLAASLVFLPAAAIHAQAPPSPGDESRGKYRVGWAVGGSADGYAVILRTDDGGVTWTRQGQAGEIPDFNAAGVSAADALHVWVVGEKVILHTRDGGLTWEQQTLPDDLPQDFALYQVKALHQSTAFAVGSQSVLLQTRKGVNPKKGSQWIRMRTASNMPLIQFSDVDALDANHVWAVGGVESNNDSRRGLAVAFYNGIHWKPQFVTNVNSGEPCSSFIGVSAVNSRNVWAVGGLSCPPYVTDGGGKTWAAKGKPLGEGLDTNRVVGVNRKMIWATTDDGIFRSVDGGASWEMTESCSGYCYAVSATGTGLAWASSLGYRPPGDLYRWVVGSGQWESQPVPAASNITMISFVGARR